MRRSIALAALAAVLAAVPPAGAAPAGAPCQLTGGFRALSELVPEVGQCVEDARAEAATGNTLQRTTGGLLVWRKVGNWTAFTDGARTWVSGPFGLQQRLATERFDWEEALGATGVALAAAPGPATCAPASDNDDPSRAAPLVEAANGTLPPAVWSRSADAPDRVSHRYYGFAGDGAPAAVAVEVADEGGYRVRVNVYAPDGSLAGTLLVGARERQHVFLGPTAPGTYLVQLTSPRPAEVQFRVELRRG